MTATDDETSKGLVYIVDEDRRQIRPYVDTLRSWQYDVEVLPRADIAYDRLVEERKGCLVVIDIMLARGEPTKVALQNEKPVSVGLALFEELVRESAPLFPAHAAFFTHVEQPGIVRRAERIAAQYNIPLWRKRDYRSGYRFASAVDDQVKRLARRQER